MEGKFRLNVAAPFLASISAAASRLVRLQTERNNFSPPPFFFLAFLVWELPGSPAPQPRRDLHAGPQPPPEPPGSRQQGQGLRDDPENDPGRAATRAEASTAPQRPSPTRPRISSAVRRRDPRRTPREDAADLNAPPGSTPAAASVPPGLHLSAVRPDPPPVRPPGLPPPHGRSGLAEGVFPPGAAAAARRLHRVRRRDIRGQVRRDRPGRRRGRRRRLLPLPPGRGPRLA